MTQQEKTLNQVEARVSNLETKFEMFIQEMRDFKTEMRDRDSQRAKEIMEIRQDMKTMQAQLDTKIDGIGKHVQNLTVAAMVGIGTAVIGIGAIAVTVMYSIFSR